MNLESRRPRLPESSARLLRALAGAGGLIVLAGVLFASERIWPSLLLATYFLVSTALALRVAWLAYTRYAYDDAFISFQYARRLADGMASSTTSASASVARPHPCSHCCWPGG